MRRKERLFSFALAVFLLLLLGMMGVSVSATLALLPAADEKSPYLQNVTQNSIVVMWETVAPVASKVRYRAQGDKNWTEAGDAGAVTIHETLLGGLDSKTIYEYQVSQNGVDQWIPASPPVFKLAPDAAQPYRVAVYGDTRTQYDRHARVAQAIIGSAPDIVLHTGDLVDQGKNYSAWGQQFFTPAADLMVDTPIFPVLGNHEYNGSGAMWYYTFFSLPGNEQWYAFSYGCSRFIGLDTNADFSPGSPQYTWLNNELQSSAYLSSTWQIVYFHHPPYTSGLHKGNEEPVADYLVPLFEQYGVDMVFAGHNHHYERSYRNGVYYFVAGGGGAPLYGFPNVALNPFSQLRQKKYHYIALDFNCPATTLLLNVWDYDGNRLDSLAFFPKNFSIYLPIVLKNSKVL